MVCAFPCVVNALRHPRKAEILDLGGQLLGEQSVALSVQNHDNVVRMCESMFRGG